MCVLRWFSVVLPALGRTPWAKLILAMQATTYAARGLRQRTVSGHNFYRGSLEKKKRAETCGLAVATYHSRLCPFLNGSSGQGDSIVLPPAPCTVLAHNSASVTDQPRKDARHAVGTLWAPSDTAIPPPD